MRQSVCGSIRVTGLSMTSRAALQVAAFILAGIGVVAGQQTSPGPQPALPTVGRAVAGGTAPPASAAPPGTGLIAGRVIDGETGGPIAAATVSMSIFGRPVVQGLPQVLTDAGGRFFFDEVPAGQVQIAANKPGWIPGALGRSLPGGAAAPLELGENARRADLSIKLWRYGVLTGRVSDDQSDPMVGVDVRIFQRTFVAGRPRLVFSTRALTDDRGVYRASTLLPGDYVVVVPASVTSEPTGSRGAGGSDVYLRTMTGLGVAPMSVGTNATLPVPGADTRVTSILPIARRPSLEGPWLTYATTFAPSARSLGTAAVVHVDAGREQSGADVAIRFVGTYQVSGVVTETDGKPAAFHAVHLLPADSADNPLFDVSTAVSDSAGAFTFHGVPPGDYIARVIRVPVPEGARVGTCGGTGAISFVCITGGSPNNGLPVPAENLFYADRAVTVVDRALRDIDLTLRAGVRATGTAQFEGTATRPTPAQWSRLGIQLEAATGRTAQAAGGFDSTFPGRFDGEGRFTTPSTWPGRYLFKVPSPPPGWTLKSVIYQGREISETALDLKSDIDGVVVNFTDRPQTLQGTVRAAEPTDQPLLVVLFPVDRSGWTDYGLTSRRVRSVSVLDSRFTMPAPPAGEYFLIALPAGQANNWQSPATLEKLAQQAERVQVSDGQSVTRTLTARPLR
jgi:hypothetical protein